MTLETGTVRWTILLLMSLGLLACTGAADDGTSADHGAPAAGADIDGGAEPPPVDAPVEPDAPAAQGAATPDVTPEVVARGRELVLVEDGATRTLATIGEDEGSLEHVAVRPGDHDADTVLALTRTGDRYELRYLVLHEDGPSELYWFPWRLQIDEGVTEHAAVSPLPVWAPDGSAVAWLEWDESGTRLRTVGWMDGDRANNPSDDTATYRLAQVPVGTQLQRWEEGDGASLLVGDDGEVEWHIELDTRERVVAMPGGGPDG